MIMQDKLEFERSHAKNAVEEYVYDLRDKLFSQLEEFAMEEVSMYLLPFLTNSPDECTCAV